MLLVMAVGRGMLVSALEQAGVVFLQWDRGCFSDSFGGTWPSESCPCEEACHLKSLLP